MLAIVNKGKQISTKQYFRNLESFELSVLTKKRLNEVRKLLAGVFDICYISWVLSYSAI